MLFWSILRKRATWASKLPMNPPGTRYVLKTTCIRLWAVSVKRITSGVCEHNVLTS